MTPPDCCCVAPSPTDHIPTSNHALEIIVPPVVPAIVSSSSRNIIVVLRIINELLSVAKNSESYSFVFSIHQYAQQQCKYYLSLFADSIISQGFRFTLFAV